MCVFRKMISVECGCHVRVKYNADDECAKCTFDSMPPALLSDSFINAFVTEHVPLVHYLQLEISVCCDRCYCSCDACMCTTMLLLVFVLY